VGKVCLLTGFASAGHQRVAAGALLLLAGLFSLVHVFCAALWPGGRCSAARIVSESVDCAGPGGRQAGDVDFPGGYDASWPDGRRPFV